MVSSVLRTEVAKNVGMLRRLKLCTRDKGENYQYHHLYYCLSRLVMYLLGKMEILPLELFFCGEGHNKLSRLSFRGTGSDCDVDGDTAGRSDI